MIRKHTYIFLMLFFFFCYVEICPGKNTLTARTDKPIQITAARMEAFKNRSQIVFSGNATVVQGDSVLKAEKLILHYRQQPKTEKAQKARDNQAGDLEKIEARGNVSVVQGTRKATADEAVYVQAENKIIMTGNAELKEGKSSIRGERVIILLDEDKGIVEGGERMRVKAVIYPQERRQTENQSTMKN
ncbi:MAG TPA: lipopolysaccharide transport periplasmic protein LptA [Smithella sp.]|nr:lipopolysaccharide transport periplasmic protein LptA [Smithella sp.]NMC97622.1 lipopolysaccharide transport periplasmic protein LptA [Deltaproteobacteria bacterium]OQC53122.1 MAG: Lipopolysaccharide export system protein LptA precursor [Deltaproteobacteria bacterium ADurb.Bin022]HNQ64859.1 lipopolysaccharide transport periplasmic protein LptA [Smithella sp.]HOE32758.1 lipopolysaccharide transport periplasmic protein LptA [Smithella sp.]